MMIPNYRTEKVREATKEEAARIREENRKANARANGHEAREAA